MQQSFLDFLNLHFQAVEMAEFKPFSEPDGQARQKHNANVAEKKRACIACKNLVKTESNFWPLFSEHFERENQEGQQEALVYIASRLEEITPYIEEANVRYEEDTSGDSWGEARNYGTWKFDEIPGHKEYNREVINPINSARKTIKNDLFTRKHNAELIARIFASVPNLDAATANFYAQMRLNNHQFNNILQVGSAYLGKSSSRERSYLDILLNSHEKLVPGIVSGLSNGFFCQTNAKTQAQWQQSYIAKLRTAYAGGNTEKLKKQILDCIASLTDSWFITLNDRENLVRLAHQIKEIPVIARYGSKEPRPISEFIDKVLEKWPPSHQFTHWDDRKTRKTECFLDIVRHYLESVKNIPTLRR